MTPSLHLSAQATTDIVVNHALTVVAEFKQHVSGQGVIAAVLDTLMDGVDIPRGYSILYADAFGYDGCLSQVVMKANARDPGTPRSCITICQDSENQSYIVNAIGTSVFNMAKSKDIVVDDFPDVQKLVDTSRQTTNDPRVSLTLHATVYLPGPRVLAMLERVVHRWTADPLMREAPRA